ncbi:hypothetical protein [Paenibacillus urinalis]|uniref:DnaD domain-containing protein n=1 Tax=Paenibacillus urinalis TaxID=521520 RepID=A0AAX3N6S3_9BACL|nr:hypothetical protein [Paenibacillus urinalis]WDH85506.1 hypothetical protein PUW23_26435 [Paenibacillus urinalis]
MEKGSVRAIALAYQTATLTYPSFEIMELLRPLPFERVLELLLIMRQSPRPVKSPLNYLRRAIQEGWSPETMPEKVDRHMEYVEENHYIRQGYTIDQAREKVQRNRR